MSIKPSLLITLFLSFFTQILTAQTPEKVATGAGHHSVINIPNTDDWYIVYHRRPIPNLDSDHRLVCIDFIYFIKDDMIKDVKITFDSVSKVNLK